jgi:hypothetical protein
MRQPGPNVVAVGWRCTPQQRETIRALLSDRGLHPSQVISYMIDLLDGAGDTAKIDVAQRLGTRSACPPEVAYRSPCDSSPARARVSRMPVGAQRAAAMALGTAIAAEPSDDSPEASEPTDGATTPSQAASPDLPSAAGLGHASDSPDDDPQPRLPIGGYSRMTGPQRTEFDQRLAEWRERNCS